MNELTLIQTTLKATKDLTNSFGGYKYRSAETILEALKPLLAETKTYINISDDIVMIGSDYQQTVSTSEGQTHKTMTGRVYVKATVTLFREDGTEIGKSTAFAREPETKKGSDVSQITGAASSYARKYSLCGLFAIDDGVDADSTNRHGK